MPAGRCGPSGTGFESGWKVKRQRGEHFMGNLPYTDAYGIALHSLVRRYVVTRADGNFEGEVFPSELVVGRIAVVDVCPSVLVGDAER